MNIIPYPLPQLTVQGEPAGDADDAAQIAQAREVFALQQRNRWSVAAAPARDRVAKLRRLRDAIIAHRGDLAEAMHADFGKPATEVEVAEVHPALDEVNHAIRHVKRWMRPVRARTPLLLAGTRSELRYEP
jgi:aldehyde dehydrogenase (NAD+)